MKTKIKICGLIRAEDIKVVNQEKPDYVGFVFAKSRRQIDLNQALELKKILNREIEAVGVFVNHPLDEVVKIVQAGAIDMVQLHGDEDKHYLKKLKDKLPDTKIIRAFRVKDDFIFKDSEQADYYLFDAYDPMQYGGSGQKFNWQLIKDIKKPFFLAGGINDSNIEEAIKTVNPYCIDVSSGVESDGFKDREKIKKIIEKVRRIK